MSLQLATVTFDCDNPQRVSEFWAKALDRTVDEGASEFFISLSAGPKDPKMFFIKVPEGKAVKNRVHVDLHADDRAVEVERLLGLGATKVGDYDEYGATWTTLRDVEGNEFCVAS
jgi:hypothetical protein